MSLPERSAPTTTVWWGACAVIALAMLAMEHDWNVSRYEGYVRASETIEATAGGGNLARRLASLGLAGAGLLLLGWGKRVSWRSNVFLALPLLLGLGWCAVSLLWSVDVGMCVRRLIVLGCYLFCALGMARAASPNDVARLCVWLGLASLALGLLAECTLGTFRPWSGEYRFAGTLHPNAQGAYLAVGAIAAWMLADTDRSRRWRWLACFALLTLFVVLTKSRTSLAGLGVAISAVALLRTSLGFKVVAGFASAWLLAVALLIVMISGFDPQAALVDAALLGRTEQAESLTGRSEIWEEVLRYIAVRPWTGYGYESFWTEDHIRRIADNIFFTILSAHSGYLELILSVGIVGLAWYLGTLFVAGTQSSWLLMRREEAQFTLLLGLILFALVCSAMESTMVTPNWAVLILGASLAQLAFFAHPTSHERKELPPTRIGRAA
jgi:O-antigen ligase